MRGKVERVYFAPQDLRITPAYAGKSIGFNLLRYIEPDHPRLCGEKCLNSKQRYNRLGSPPPMRGKAVKFVIYFVLYRITPAYAGKRKVGGNWRF